MRAGDWLLIGCVAAGVLAIAADAASNGAIGAWTSDNLSGAGLAAGRALGWIGWALTPLLALPLLVAVFGAFAGAPEPLARGLSAGVRAVDAVNTTIGDAARWFALGLVAATGVIVIQRYVFGIASTKLQESVIYMHALLFLLSSASTLLAGGHVRVDILYNRLGPRGKAWTDMAGVYLALLPMCWLILSTSQSYVGGAWRILERSRESDGLPLVFLLKTAIPVFAVMMAAQGAAMAARAALTLSGREAPSHPGATAEL